MSTAATTRAWSSAVGGNDLLVLLALADFAGGEDDPYDYAFPAVKTLAQKTKVSERTVQRCLRSLEQSEHIRVTGQHVWGRGKVTTQYRIEGDKSTGRQSDGGVRDDVGGVTPVTPNPSSNSPSREGGARAKKIVDDEFPADLPAELHDVAIQAGKILKATALRRQQKKTVTRAAVGHAVLTFPDREHVVVARDVENWLLHGKGATKPCADVVARFRQFLKSSEPMAGPPLPAGVAPIRGGRDRKGDDGGDAERLRNMRLRMEGQR